MESLQNPTLVKIFTKLGYKDCRACAKVCRKWRSLINSEIGKKVYLGKGNEILWGESVKYFQDIQTITRIGILNCTVSGEIGDEIPKFKYPKLVKCIKFDSEISLEKFNGLVKDLINLKRIRLHDGFWNGSQMYLAFTGFENLTELFFGFTNEEIQKRANRNVLENIMKLLDRVYFPQLGHFRCTTPCGSIIEPFLLATIFNFVTLHKEHLKILVLLFFKDNKLPENLNLPTKKPCSLSDLRQIKLNTLVVASDGGITKKNVHINCLLSEQSTLQRYFDMQLPNIYQFPSQTILNNLKTLVSIALLLDGERASLIDCALTFGKCEVLRYLTLENSCAYTSNNNYGECRLIGLNSLPKSIQSIQLRGIMTREELKPLGIGFPNLKRLGLWDLVDEQRCELKIEMVSEILNKKTILNVFIAYGTAEGKNEWLKDFESNHSIMTEIRKSVLAESFFCIHLKNGNYQMGPPSEDIFPDDPDPAPPSLYDNFHRLGLKETNQIQKIPTKLGPWDRLNLDAKVGSVRRVRSSHFPK